MNEHAEWWTVTDTCAALGKSDKSVRRMITRGDLRAVKVKTDTGQEWRVDPASVGQGPDSNGHTRKSNRWEISIETDNSGQEQESLPDNETDARIARVEGFQVGHWAAQLMEELRASREDHAALRDEVRALREEIAAMRAERAHDAPEVTTTTINDALTESLIPYLEQVQEVSQSVDRVQAENEQLKKELLQKHFQKGPHDPWWKFWRW